MGDKLIIKKKESLKGEDGHKVFSIRVKTDTLEALEKIVQKTGSTRNELVNLLLDYAIQNCEIQTDDK